MVYMCFAARKPRGFYNARQFYISYLVYIFSKGHILHVLAGVWIRNACRRCIGPIPYTYTEEKARPVLPPHCIMSLVLLACCSATPPGPLAAAAQEAGKLSRYWRTLPVQHKLRLVRDLPEAGALVSEAGEAGDGERRCCGDVVHNLVLAPVAWCYKVRWFDAFFVGRFPIFLFHKKVFHARVLSLGEVVVF